MKKGHRRTQSENVFNSGISPKLKIKLKNQSNHKRMLSLIKANTTLKKQKTVCIESLELPKSKSHYSHLFVFGKRDEQDSTLANSPFSHHLLSIPERKPVSHTSLQKGLKKERTKTPMKGVCKKVRSREEERKVGKYLVMKGTMSVKRLGKGEKKQKTKELFYKKWEEGKKREKKEKRGKK